MIVEPETAILRQVGAWCRDPSQGRGRIRDDEDLHEWVRENLGVVIPRQACCDSHTAPFDAFADAFFARHSMAVWVGSRGFAGKSFLLAALGLAEAVDLGAGVRVLGGSADQSENVVRYTEQMMGHPRFPPGMLAASGRQPGLTKTRIRLINGGSVVAMPASTRAVRGPHESRLRIDEADELALDVLDASLGQTMAKGGVAAQTVISSTHHKADGTMTEVLRRAADRGWFVARWCYRCTMRTEDNPTGWLAPAEVERKRAEVPSAMFAVEYDLDEPSPESRAILPDKVEAMFQKALGEKDGGPREYLEFEPPIGGARYSTGCDWAKDRDWTIIITVRDDVEPSRVVAFQRRGREPYPDMVEAFNEQARRYPGRAYHDATGGSIGSAIHDYLEVHAEPITLVGRKRSEMLSRYVAAVEGGEVVSPRVAYMHAEHKFATVDDLYGSGHLPDTICAMALAWLGCEGRPASRPPMETSAEFEEASETILGAWDRIQL